MLFLSFDSLKELLERFENNNDNKEDEDKDETYDDDENDDDVENDGNGNKEFFLTTSEKILLGVTSPVWFPVATTGVIVASPFVAGYFAVRKFVNKRKIKLFSEDPKAHMKKETKSYLHKKKEDDMLERAGKYIEQTEKAVYSYEQLIPMRIKALKELAEKLENETRLEAHKNYDNISRSIQSLRDEICPLKNELSTNLLGHHA